MQAQQEVPALVQEAHPVGTRPSRHPLNPHPPRRSPSLSLVPLKNIQLEAMAVLQGATNWFFNFQK